MIKSFVKFADELRRRHGRVPSAAEAYEISEYGAPADADHLHELLGAFPTRWGTTNP